MPAGAFRPTYRNMENIKVDLMLQAGQLAIVRSNCREAEELIKNVVAFARGASTGVWEGCQARVIMTNGLLAHAKGELRDAARCFKAVRKLCEQQNKTANRTGSKDSDLLVLARASYVLVRIAQGAVIQTRVNNGNVTASGEARRKRRRKEAGEEDDDEEDLEDLVKEIKAGGDKAVPLVQIAAQIVSALTGGEIVRSK